MLAAHAVYHRCFSVPAKTGNRSVVFDMGVRLEQDCDDTERFPVMAGTGIRLHPTGFRISRICCLYFLLSVDGAISGERFVRQRKRSSQLDSIDNPGFVKQQEYSRHKIKIRSKFKTGSTYLLLSAFVVVTRRFRFPKRVNDKSSAPCGSVVS